MKSRYNSFNRFNIKSIGHLFVMMIVSFSLVTFAGCGSDSSTTTGPTGNNGGNNEEPMDEQAENEVLIEGNTFNVSNLEVSAGTTVTWTNNSSVDHTITSGTRGTDDAGELFDRTISPGQTVTITFDEAGTYPYFCKFHSGMDAEVTVTD